MHWYFYLFISLLTSIPIPSVSDEGANTESGDVSYLMTVFEQEPYLFDLRCLEYFSLKGGDLSAGGNIALFLAITQSKHHLLDFLLSKVDLTINGDMPLNTASSYGDEVAVMKLLADTRVNPSASDVFWFYINDQDYKVETSYFSILSAWIHGHWNVAKLLLDDYRVDRSLVYDAAINLSRCFEQHQNLGEYWNSHITRLKDLAGYLKRHNEFYRTMNQLSQNHLFFFIEDPTPRT